ncbi:hypothetical protein K438DRAFT_1932143 [Mycena galopus ATCC 62051]|nr:hypothetical protein K438DRAFT_1932143 [Mycena galopus ATCC 62051]
MSWCSLGATYSKCIQDIQGQNLQKLLLLSYAPCIHFSPLAGSEDPDFSLVLSKKDIYDTMYQSARAYLRYGPGEILDFTTADANGRSPVEVTSPFRQTIEEILAPTRTYMLAPEPSEDADVDQRGTVAIALCDYEAVEKDELSFRKGDKIVVINAMTERWWQGKDSAGNVGLFPRESTLCGMFLKALDRAIRVILSLFLLSLTTISSSVPNNRLLFGLTL